MEAEGQSVAPEDIQDAMTVPPHIVPGDAIVVNTEDDSYIERTVGLVCAQRNQVNVILILEILDDKNFGQL
ncbi:hypothetical protein VNO80_23907 [Phaseolus coccineus]|uniref:Elongation factor P C-terminal domain-containing protein n=1 Tax=Phaseolus coccineus TaxID=3886 RepID=A0AAN9QRU6_PHACN